MSNVEEMEMYVDNSGTYLESLSKCRSLLNGAPHLLTKLDNVLELELDLALMAAEKAKSEIIKASAKDKDNLRPIK